MSEPLIRIGREEDIPAISGVYTGPPESPWDPFGDPERMRRIPLEGLLVAEVDHKVVGFLYWFRGSRPYFDPEVEDFANIQELHVAPEHQGRGIGRKLLERALTAARELGVKVAYIDTDDFNARAMRLYGSAGFREHFRAIHYKMEL
jgi:ribosomal protein S18 acetylase RimI-like enzyme